jgi:hypothetical protein
LPSLPDRATVGTISWLRRSAGCVDGAHGATDGAASGRGRRRQKGVIIAESCLVLDVNQLLAKGCLEPGWNGVWQWTAPAAFTTAAGAELAAAGGRGGNVVYSVNLRAKAGRRRPLLSLLLSWTSVEGGAMAEIIPIAYTPCGFGSHRALFVCPGEPPHDDGTVAATATTTTTTTNNNPSGASNADDDAGTDANADAGGGDDGVAAAGCGRRVTKLYFSQGRFRCRHCHGVIHGSVYEPAWRRAYRKAHKLRQRLGLAPGAGGSSGIDGGGSGGGAVPGKPKGMTVRNYERLLEAAQQAEARAYDADTKQIRQLAARIERRIKPKFTL